MTQMHSFLLPLLQVVYEVQKREKAAAKQALAQKRAADPKEVRFSCQIGEHDLGVKMAQVGVLTASMKCAWSVTVCGWMGGRAWGWRWALVGSRYWMECAC